MTVNGGGTYAVTGTPPLDAGTWPVEINGDGTRNAFTFEASAGEKVVIKGIKFTGTWPGSGYDGGAIRATYNNNTAIWIIHDNLWTGSGRAIAILKANRGGLIYNNYFNDTSGGTLGIAIKEITEINPKSDGYCATLMMEAPNWGGSNFTFIEDNTWYSTVPQTGESVIDYSFAAKVVARYNYFYNGFMSIHNITNDYVRGHLASEIYENTLSASGASNWLVSIRSGTVLIHDNTLDANYYHLATIYMERTGADNTWGSCASANPWDGNGTPDGYPCLDQPGRAEANGSSFTFDPDTSNIQPQELWPIYMWDNTNSSVTESSDYFTEDVDYYICASGCVEGTDYPSGYTPYTYPHPLRGEYRGFQGCTISGGVSTQ